jgi:ACS family hexuronate transporter-like MFS transporter
LQTTAEQETALRRYPTWRWYICALLFFACTINYVDRQVMSLLKEPVFLNPKQLTFGTHHLVGDWSNADFGWVMAAFQLAYAIMMPIAGRLIDWIGPKRGYAVAILIWSASAMCHALARNVWQFALARFCLGIGESANFPAAIRTIATWFPQQERALATGLFNSGTNVGVMVAALAVPWVIATTGSWRFAFLFTAGLVFLWLILWFTGYRRAPVSVVRLETAKRRIPYYKLLKNRGAWAVLLGKFLTDPVWWFYLFWLPGILFKKFGLNLLALGAPLVVIYLMADVGSVGGGWLSTVLLKRGVSLDKARKSAMLLCAVLVIGAMFVPLSYGNLWLTIVLIGLAAGAHQGWSANLMTLASDLFPEESVGSVTGLGGLGGAIGGVLVQPLIGYWLDFSHNSDVLFIVAGSMYLIAFFIIHLLVPKLERQNV